MTENIISGYPQMDVEEAAQLMQEHQIKRLLVIENGEVQGVVSLGDLGAKKASQIAGNILSEVSKGENYN
nr:CBS domain-containing protein [Thalassobacillus sp. CUG 92003]